MKYGVLSVAAAMALAGCATNNVAWHDANHLNYEHPPQGIYTVKDNASQTGAAIRERGDSDAAGPVAGNEGAARGVAGSERAAVEMSSADLQFLKSQMSSGVFEVNAGEEALRKSSDAHVQAVARQTISDRTGLNRQLSDLAAAKGLNVPERMDREDEQMLDGLKAANGADFDRLYIGQLSRVSDVSLAQLQNEASYGQDPDVRRWADATAPWARGTLSMITTPGATNMAISSER